MTIEELKEILTKKLDKRIQHLVILELLNKYMIILKVMTFIHYNKKNKKS